MAEALKSVFLILSALFPIVDPLGGSPIFLSLTREYSPASRRALLAAHRDKQLLSSDGIVLDRNAHSCVFRDFAAGGAGRRGSGGDFSGVDAAEARRRRRQRRRPGPETASGAPRSAPPRLLSPDFAPDGRARVHFGGHYAGRECPHHRGINIMAILAAAVGSVLLAVSIFICYAFAGRLGRMLGPTGMTVVTPT